MFGPLLLAQLELHRARWTPLKAGMKMRSKLNFRYEIVEVNGEKVTLRRLNAHRGRQRARTTIWHTTLKAVEKRLSLEP